MAAFMNISVLYAALGGFVAGFFMPLTARRFSKFMPADPATALVMSFHKPRIVHGKSAYWRTHYSQLRKQLLMQCLVFAAMSCVLCASLVALVASPVVWWNLLFVLVLLLLSAIDMRFHLLPDVLTQPLMLVGFLMSVVVPGYSPQASAAGAVFGYCLPLIAGVIMHYWRPRAMGGGDYKMLAAMGAWLGIMGLNLALLVAVVIFVGTSVVLKQRSGPFGPALAAGAIASLMWPVLGLPTGFFLP